MGSRKSIKGRPKSSESNTDEPVKVDTPAKEDQKLRMSYEIARGEQGVLTFEPYKSMLLQHWRFKNPEVASESSSTLWRYFVAYVKAEDFVGADMTRKLFIQMGMTRAKRYANHAGGRKYRQLKNGDRGEELARSTTHKDHESKLEASNIFREVWKRCQENEQYGSLRKRFEEEKKAWKARPESSAEGGEDQAA